MDLAPQKGFQRANFSTRLAILECAKLVDCSPLLAVMDGGKWSRVLRNGDVLTNPAFHSNLSQTWVTVNNFESYILVNSHTNTSHLYTSHSSKSQLIKYICELKFSIIFARAGVLTEKKNSALTSLLSILQRVTLVLVLTRTTGRRPQ